ncbi:CAF17-like 4Fe-4S cluster assembly/insertion protein YgfZ [Fodinicurvata fenggangensis]|uniref:CAF17-like 4Fe-4S cluster assembly/insertion protein YgfZ n=1 Tax=Fodinicurvata fenggangensis TaxID=1121830 RepID=UPI00047CE8FE|nr:folate-binding protein YgfZ [Fodinicurvata fenggangensis]
MSRIFAVKLEDRGLLALSGPDLRDFLQGIVSNDVNRVSASQSIWAAFLTPQGKYLYDFFISQPTEGTFWLDVEAERRADLMKRLRMYKLRSKVEMTDLSEDYEVHALYGETSDILDLPPLAGASQSYHDGVLMRDPRHLDIGLRLVAPKTQTDQLLSELEAETGTREDYDVQRIALGLPDGSRDMEAERATLLENGFDELGGVDWQKGCYMGQELTARTKYRGLVKKRLMPVKLDGSPPDIGTAVTLNGKQVGEIRSSAKGRALALLRLDIFKSEDSPLLEAGEARLTPHPPDWADFWKDSR